MEIENNYQETDLGNVSLNPRGEYDPGASYEYLDTVSYQGGSYMCLAELGAIITGTAPDPGHNTDTWQMLTLPGDLTPEYIAMHDDTVNHARQAESSRLAAELAQQATEDAQADVQQLHTDTRQAATEAGQSRDSAAGYAQSADASRRAAAESEQNINAQVTGFDTKVSESVTQAQEEIAAARQQAINAITAQETKSETEVKRVGIAALTSAEQALQEIEATGRQAVRAVTDQQNTSVQAVKDETKSYIEEKKQEISAKTNEVTQAVNQAGEEQLQNIADSLDSTLTESGKAADAAAVGKKISSLKEDIDNLSSSKITKFYASSQGETHLADSDDGKIMDMMVYGKSEQKQYSGKNLLNATLQTTTKNGVTCTANGDGTYTLNGTATSDTQLVVGYHNILDGQVKILGCPSRGSIKTYCVIMQFSSDITGGEKGRIYDIGNGEAGSTSNSIESGANYIRGVISIISGTTCNNLLFKPMLTTDLTATYNDFESYTGGHPSPSPDYPQEIKSVVNPTVKVRGKNLLNYDAWKEIPIVHGTAVFENHGVTLTATSNDCYTAYIPNVFTIAKIPVSEGEVVTLSWEYDGKDGQIYIFPNGTIGKHVSAKNEEKKISYTVPSGATFITFRFGVTNAGDTISYRNIQIEKGSTPTTYEPYHEQTVTLPYTLNAIPVNSGGNVTIDGQQYIADYVDVERGKLVRMVDFSKLDNTQSIIEKNEWLLAEPQEADLTKEEITAFKALTTYYPVTNISVNSEQIDGYTVFNYPISMENGWNYVKQQIGDTREYIYDMDAHTQDTDLQAAEAYVNSEYAVALTELEV